MDYSAAVRIKLSGAGLRGRASTLVAFRRPDSLRVEVPGPGGLRMLAVARDGELMALFPGERAVYRADATERTFEELFGVRLAPSDVMDLLVGAQPAAATSVKVWWGTRWPERVDARIEGGGKLDMRVEDPEGAPVPDAAFVFPDVRGYRSVGAAEARRFWGAR
jgi:hypothetical protein